MNKKNFAVFILLFVGLVFPLPVNADVGVGVGTGKMVIDELLNPGMEYELPPLTVLNTGDEFATYGASIAYHQDQDELEPPIEWFSFKPVEFDLEPGESQIVEITMKLPVKAEPGDYFAYVEGFPKSSTESGGTNISIAAASKLYFTVAPATLLKAIMYKISSFWNGNKPWTDISAGLVLLYLVYSLLKDRVDISFSFKKKSTSKGSPVGQKGSDALEKSNSK